MNQPIKTLPKYIREEFKAMAGFLYSDLEFKKSVTTLAPAPYPKHSNHKIRVVQEAPPKWYSKLYWDIQGNRHRKKRIGGTRLRILVALNSIFMGRDHENKRYTNEIRCRVLIKQMLIEGFTHEDQDIPPNNNVVDYFENI